MATWTSDELRRIAAAEELELGVSPTRRHAGTPGDDLGRPRRRRPVRPVMEGPHRLLVPRQSGAPRRAHPGRRPRQGRHVRGRSRPRHQRSGRRRVPHGVPAAMVVAGSTPWCPLKRGPRRSSSCRAQRPRSLGTALQRGEMHGAVDVQRGRSGPRHGQSLHGRTEVVLVMARSTRSVASPRET